jgi:hypothetical protein
LFGASRAMNNRSQEMETRLREGFPHREDDNSVAKYVGSGALSLPGGGVVQCRFRADQDADGSIQIVFGSISALDFVHHLVSVVKGGITAEFRGTTDDGVAITAKCVGGRALSLDSAGNATIYFTLRGLVAHPEIALDAECRLLITNFAFSPFTHLGEPPAQPPPHILFLDVEPEAAGIEIKPLDDYVRRIVRLQQTRTVLPTASLIIKTKSSMSVAWYHDLASNLCKLISVAAGTAVEWIAADGFDPEKNKHYRFHSARVTKPFCSLPTIPIKDFGFEANTTILGRYLQAGFNRLREGDERQLSSLIAAFLDARLEGEYLETRGIKIAVTLEIIRSAFADRLLNERWDAVMPSALRKNLTRVTSAALKAEGFDAEVIKLATETLNQLSRPSLRRQIDYILEALTLTVDKTVVDAVVAIRNRLVHTGRFISNVNPKRAGELKITDSVQEFYILLSFVDRLLLRTLDHTGPYMDYSTSDNSQLQHVIRGFRA